MSTRISHGYRSAVHYIDTHDLMQCTMGGVSGYDLNCGRAPGLAKPDEKRQLHPVLRPMWNNRTRHSQGIGLNHSKCVV